MALRKVHIFSQAALGNNIASFVNVTSEPLHIRRLVLTFGVRATVVALDGATASVDETAQQQASVDDSRAHLMHSTFLIGDGTGAGLAPTYAQQVREYFGRGDLRIDEDEAIYLNSRDVVGTPSVEAMLDIFYED